MSKPTNKLTWCKARLGEDMNWWIHEISDSVHWDADGLGIIDPRQFQYIIDLLEPLSDYGLQNELVDDAFYSFGIDKVEKDKTVLLKRVQDSILESEDPLFALPDVLDEEKGPYADLLDHITKLRVKMLNDPSQITFSLKACHGLAHCDLILLVHGINRPGHIHSDSHDSSAVLIIMKYTHCFLLNSASALDTFDDG